MLRAPFSKYYIWEQFVMPYILKKWRTDVLHGPRGVLPLAYGRKAVVTIHDLAFLLFPNYIKFNPIRYWPLFVRRSALKANHVIAVSENTKQDIIRLFGIPAHKITVTHEACSDAFKPITDQNELKKTRVKYNLPDRFIVFVGTIEPRKNLNTLLKALYIIKNMRHSTIKVVFAGKKGWLYSDFFELIKKLHLEDNIVFTGYVEEKDLPCIYSLADVFVYPSRYEGFGLPLVEAMSCGVPVIASDSSSIPEVLGDAGILFPHDSPKHLCRSLLEILENEDLQKALVSRGLKRAQEFSWQKTAIKTLDVYETIHAVQ